MNKTIRYVLLGIGLGAIFVESCKKDNAPPTNPSVTTAALTNITISGATSGGTITNNGGAAITNSGIVWSKTNVTPTLTDSIKNSSTTSGSYTINLTGLEFNTIYYIRAFATNSVGTSYGDVVTLNTTNDTSKVRFTYMGQTVVYGVITSPITGKKWMDRNLGANQVAAASNDTASYGHVFQWGRGADGHQLKTSVVTNIQSSTDAPGHNKFITSDATTGDWRNPHNAVLWQGSTGVNNPCPSGWHVPTKAEWQAETGITNAATGFAQLKLPIGTYRYLDATLHAGVTSGYYWSSTPEPNGGSNLSYDFYMNTTSILNNALTDRGQGFAIRCIRD